VFIGDIHSRPPPTGSIFFDVLGSSIVRSMTLEESRGNLVPFTPLPFCDSGSGSGSCCVLDDFRRDLQARAFPSWLELVLSQGHPPTTPVAFDSGDVTWITEESDSQLVSFVSSYFECVDESIHSYWFSDDTADHARIQGPLPVHDTVLIVLTDPASVPDVSVLHSIACSARCRLVLACTVASLCAVSWCPVTSVRMHNRFSCLRKLASFADS
jgi:hypothetical protein